MKNLKPLMQMKKISKSFPGVKALQEVDLEAYAGEALALLGENGAGKSTLVKILSGVYKKDAGQILIEEKEVDIRGIKEAEELGIAIIHQELSLLRNLTIYENIFLGNEIYNSSTRKLNKSAMKKSAIEYLREIGSSLNPETLVKDINVGDMQMVEIVKALSKKSKIIVMDEPTTALTDVETVKLFEVMRKLKSQGIAIIYITHRMDEIFEICDKVEVLRDGKYIGSTDVNQVTKDDLITMMVGRKLEEQFPHIEVPAGEKMIEVKGISYGNRVKNVSFDVKKGEILGLAGLMGAGRTEVAKLIFGEFKKSSGEILIEGKKVEINSPKAAIKAGIAYLSEDRKQEGLNLNMTTGKNMTLCALKQYEKAFLRLDQRQERKIVNQYIDKLSIKTTGPDQMIRNLSGGNQQKVIISKWLLLNPRILIVDEPTRGIDVGAKKEIYDILNKLKQEGKAIIVISSDMPEILGITDRILVMHEGEITGELKRSEASQEAVMKYALNIKELPERGDKA
jgi:ribose transport system ATP-binding protein